MATPLISSPFLGIWRSDVTAQNGGDTTRTCRCGNQNPMPYHLATPLWCQMCIAYERLSLRFSLYTRCRLSGGGRFRWRISSPLLTRHRHFSHCHTKLPALDFRNCRNRTRISGGMGVPLPPVSCHLITFRYAPYPQRCVLLPHCQTAAFSGFSLDWFSGYQQEEDSFVFAVSPFYHALRCYGFES